MYISERQDSNFETSVVHWQRNQFATFMIQAYGTLIDFRTPNPFISSISVLPSHLHPNTSQESSEIASINRLLKMNRMIYKLKAVFPFDLFPDELVIDENKISLYTREFFFANDVRCILYKDIQYVEVISSVLFASIVIKLIGLPHDYIQIGYLKKSEAYKARRIIQGLMESTRESIDFSQYSIPSIIKHVERIGTAHGSELN